MNMKCWTLINTDYVHSFVRYTPSPMTPVNAVSSRARSPKNDSMFHPFTLAARK